MSSALPHSEIWTGRELASLLAPTLGREKSEDLVAAAARHLGLSTAGLDRHETAQVLDLLSQEPGIVGVASRFARVSLDGKRRARAQAAVAPRPAPPPASRRGTEIAGAESPAAIPGPPSSRVMARRIPVSDLVGLLAATIGQEKSAESIVMATRLKGINDEALTQDQAIAVLDVLAETAGIVGVTARFAKVRLMLRFQQR